MPSKDELIQRAEVLGIEVDPTWTKNVISEKISEVEAAPEENPQGDAPGAAPATTPETAEPAPDAEGAPENTEGETDLTDAPEPLVDLPVMNAAPGTSVEAAPQVDQSPKREAVPNAPPPKPPNPAAAPVTTTTTPSYHREPDPGQIDTKNAVPADVPTLKVKFLKELHFRMGGVQYDVFPNTIADINREHALMISTSKPDSIVWM